jgi:hypothetical protein
MKALDDIWNDRSYDRETSYTANIGLMLQPCSFTDFHKHVEFVEIFRRWTQNDRFRGLDFARIWSMVLNVKHALSRCPGSVAELGVYQGQSAALLSFYAETFGRKMYLADTFQGFADEQYEPEMGPGKQVAFKDVTLESAQAVVGDYEGNRWVVGVFPGSVTDEMREDTYAFVSIDCDLYEPIREGLDFFWPRMASGGIIFIHDYSSGHWPGAMRAVDEFSAQNGVEGCLLPDLAGSYVIVRPRSIAGKEPDWDTSGCPRNNSAPDENLTDLKTELDQAQTDAVRLRAELQRIYRSRSWRITKPLRLANSALHRLRVGL